MLWWWVHNRVRFLASFLLPILIATAIVSRQPALHFTSARPEHNAVPHISTSETSDQAAAQQTTEGPAAGTQNLPPRTATQHSQQSTPTAPEGSAQTATYTVTKGESVESIARRYLSQTSFMTEGELASAIRQANGGSLGKSLQ